MAPDTVIRIVEYWIPSEDGSLLEFGGGVFGGATRFEAATERLCFGKGEGLPGQVWELGHLVVLNDLSNANFRRSAAARAEGLSCGIALPVLDGHTLRAVVVMFCGNDQAHAGAIERSADRVVPVAIDHSLAMPDPSTGGAEYVAAFLSALATPIARAVSVWEQGPEGTPQRRFGFSEAQGVLEGPATDSEGLIARAFARSQPAVFGSRIAIPVAPGGRVSAVMALDF